MHLNSNTDSRRFLENNIFSGNIQREPAQRYGPPIIWGTPDKTVLQTKDTNIDYSQQYHHGIDHGDIKNNNRSISPISKQAMQAPSSPYTSNSPFKKITGIKKTPNGKQASFHQHQSSNLSSQGANQINNSNYYNNSQETTLNTTDASFTQFLNQTANRSILGADFSTISQQQQNPQSQRQTRQAASMHCQAQMNYKSPQNTHASKVIQGGLANIKGNSYNTQSKSNYTPYTPTYHQATQNRQHHSVYASPMNTSNLQNNSQYLNDSQSGYNRNKSGQMKKENQGVLLYNNMINDSSSNHGNSTQNSVYQTDESNENIRLNSLASARGHNKNLSCFAQQSVYQQTNHNNSVNDNFTAIATKQINQIENFFSNPRSYTNLNQTPTSNSNNNSSSMTPTYKQQSNNGVITPRQLPKHTPDNQERILSNLNSQMNNNRNGNNYQLVNNNFNANTPTNHKHQNSCFQNFEYYGNQNNPSASPQPQLGLNVEQSIPSQTGHSKSHSLHQQRSVQSFHTSGGSINQSNFLQNSSFINHINNKQFDSKSTFNPSSNFGSIAQNKSGFFNSQSSFLNSNGGFLPPAESQSGNYLQGIQSNSQQQYMPSSVVQLNANATINGMLGQQYQQGNALSKGPQLQKIIDDLKENIVKDLESLTNKLYKESEQIMNNSCNQPSTNIYDSIQNAPIKLAEFNIGDDKKIRFSFSGREVITQITSTNMKLKKDIQENNEDVISTYKTPLNSSQFLSPQQQQLLTEQIISSGFGQMGIHHTPKNASKSNNDSSTALHTFSSPQSADESQSSVSQNKGINTAPTLSPNNIKRPNIFKNPSKLFEKGQKENKNGNSFQSSMNGEKEDTPSNRNDTSAQNSSKLNNFEDSVRITYAQQSQGEEKLFEEFFKNNESQESRQSNVCLNIDQNTALTMVPEPENKFKSVPYKSAAAPQNQNNNNQVLNQQKEFIQFSKPVIANENNEKQIIKEEKLAETNNKIVTPLIVDKNNKELQKQNDQNSASTPQKKEQKLNTEESENAPGKQTPCFQSSKSKRSNKNNVQQKTSSDEKNVSQHLTPFCLKFDNINKTLKSSSSSGSDLNVLDQKDSNQSIQLSSKNALIRSNIQSEEQYESELQSLTQNLSVQNKNDNLSDQDDVVLRTDNTDQLSEGSPKLPIYCSNKKSNKKDHNNSSKNKIPLGQLQNQLEHIHEKECESGNSTPNAQISQNQSNTHSDLEEKKKKSQFQEYLNSGSAKAILKEDQHNQMKNSQTSAANSQLNSNTSLNQKQIENIHYNSNNNNSPLLQVPSSKMEQSQAQDHCSYRGSAKSNHSSSSSSAQNRYQDSAVSSRKQSFVENPNDSSYLNNSNIQINTAINNNNNNNSFVSTPGSNLKSSRYQQYMFNTPNNNNQNNTSLRSKKIEEYSQGKNQNAFNINSNNVSSLSNNQHTSSASNLLNATNIRFSTYLKQFEETKNQQNQNQGLVFDNKNFNSNISSNNTSYTSSQTPNNLNISNYSSQPRTQLQTTSPVSNNNITPRQFLFKNKSNLTLFQEYEAKMKTPTKQAQADLNVSQNSVLSGNNNIAQQQVLTKPNTPSQSKIVLNNAQMNKLQEVKQKQLEGNEDEVHTSRENPLEQIRENTNNTQENEDSHFTAFQNPLSNRPSANKKLSFLDNHNNSLLKNSLSNTEPKKEVPKPVILDNAIDQPSQQNFFNRTTPTQDKFVIKKDLYYVPIVHETSSHQKDADNKNVQKNEKEENSSVSNFKQNTQPASSTFYLSARSNFYESTQKLIEDSVIIQNKKNDLSNGNISKYSYSSSHSKSSNNNSNNKNVSDQEDKRSENNSRILRNPIDDDDDAILNIGENLEINQLINSSKEIPNSQVNSTPEKIKKSSPNQQNADPNTNKSNQQTKESQNEGITIISNFESQTMISDIQDNKKQISDQEDTPSSTVLFNDNSESSQKKRQQFTFNIQTEQSNGDIGICRNLKQEIDTDYQFQDFGSKRSSQEEEESNSEQTSSDLVIGEGKEAQQAPTLLHSQTTPNIQLCKNTSIDIELQNKNSYPMKEFTFSANSSTSINNDASSNKQFQKSQSHQQLSKVISSSIQVEDEDGCEITVSIVSHKRSSINQSKTILKKSLMGSPTSSALAKASSVKKSQRRISFKDKIEEVYNFEPEDRSTSRSPISNKLPRSQLRVNLKKEPYFDSIKKFPNIQKDPTFYQQYKNKNASNTSWNIEEKSNQNETSLNSDNTSFKNKNTSSQEENKPPSYLIQRRDSSSQLNNIEEFGNTRSFRPLCFTPGGSNSSKKQTKITFLEYSKINKVGENK